jgi:hypothetical protein
MHPDETPFPLCRHLKTKGTRCRSAAISGQEFCYFHARLHKDHPAPLTAQEIVRTYSDANIEAWRRINEDPMTIARAYPRQNEFNFPPLEDAESVQLAGSMLFHAIAQGHIHPQRARILVAALRIVGSTMRRASTAPPNPADVVRDIHHTATGIPLAPAALGTPEPTATQPTAEPNIQAAAQPATLAE